MRVHHGVGMAASEEVNIGCIDRSTLSAKRPADEVSRTCRRRRCDARPLWGRLAATAGWTSRRAGQPDQRAEAAPVAPLRFAHA